MNKSTCKQECTNTKLCRWSSPFWCYDFAPQYQLQDEELSRLTHHHHESQSEYQLLLDNLSLDQCQHEHEVKLLRVSISCCWTI